MNEKSDNLTSKFPDSFSSFFDEVKEEGVELDDLPKIEPNESPVTMKEQVDLGTHEELFQKLMAQCDVALSQLEYKGPNDYALVKSEIGRMHVEFDEDASAHELSRQIGVVQVMKDRLIEIYAEAYRAWTVRKRINECLFDAFSAVSSQKSVDKRKGEANLRLADYAISSAEAEAFYQYTKQIVENLESQLKTISRRISCMQMQLAIGELNTDHQDLGIPSRKEVSKIFKDEDDDDRVPGIVDWDDI